MVGGARSEMMYASVAMCGHFEMCTEWQASAGYRCGVMVSEQQQCAEPNTVQKGSHMKREHHLSGVKMMFTLYVQAIRETCR